MIKVIIFLILNVSIFTMSSGEYWKALNDRANKLFSGLDLAFEISTSISTDTDNQKPVGEVKFNVPLYSSKEQQSKRVEKQRFLEKGAELIKKLEVNERFLVFLKDQERIKKATMYEEGASGTDQSHADQVRGGGGLRIEQDVGSVA